jgi:hypothetical protein
MSDLLKFIENIGPYLQTVLWVAGLTLFFIAAAATVYIAKTTFGPVLVIVRWMFDYRPGERPNDIVAGLSIGARMLAWAAIIGLVTWFFLH